MAPSKNTSLRISGHLRDEIARLAELRGTSMLDVVTDAVQQLGRDEWWSSVRTSLDGLSETEVTSCRAESARLDAASADGLDKH